MSWEKIFRLSNSNQCCLEPYKKKCCFTIGNTMAKQNAGIHKGIDPALFWANLFLYLLESKYIQQHFSFGSPRPYRCHGKFRFKDDLCAINDNRIFLIL